MTWAKPKIFAVVEYYLPGYKAGGGPWTIANVMENLGEQFESFILARDHDWTDPTPYSSVRRNAWNQVGKSQVFYASHSPLRNLRRLVGHVRPDVFLLNSAFCRPTIGLLLLRELGVLPALPTIIAPEGEFSPGALAIKPLRKRAYLALARRCGLFRNLLWRASSPVEQEEIRAVLGGNGQISVAPDFPGRIVFPAGSPLDKPAKFPGEVRFVFLSRISAKKNLPVVLELLKTVKGRVTLDIYGVTEDASHWRECCAMIGAMPTNVKVTYKGVLSHDQVPHCLVQYHFFVLATASENFGHAILEAMAAGCPVVISDQTPWRDLAAKQIGWDIPLCDRVAWRAVLQECIDMEQTAYQRLSEAARLFAIQWISSPQIAEAWVALLEQALGGGSRSRGAG
jgi:glycosyltransferase involved in cell wall biosynthesis